jgi:hypothetical protein
MFRTDPFDDVKMRLDMDDPQPEIDQVQRELERSTKNFKGWEHDIQKKGQRFALPSPEQVKL